MPDESFAQPSNTEQGTVLRGIAAALRQDPLQPPLFQRRKRISELEVLAAWFDDREKIEDEP